MFVSFEQVTAAEQVAQALGRALEGEAFAQRGSEEQWSEAIALFRSRRVLLVWDNFESTLPQFEEGELAAYAPEARERLHELYRALTEGQPTGRLLVTCRPEETGLAGIKEIGLGGLARPDSLHLVAAVADVKGIDTDREGFGREAVDRLLNTLQDHPLSLALVSPHLATRTPDEIGGELGELIEQFADGTALEQRNQSLLASLEFSKRRLSEAARAVLPYLAWFRGGVFEQFLVDFAELDAEAWAAVRAELVATALVRVEEIGWSTTPFLHFHPTLPFAARATDVADAEATEERFVGLYLAVMRMVDQAFKGNQPAAGMALMRLEETNFRAAMERAVRRGDRREGAWLADTLQRFLNLAGRLREQRALVDWVREQTPDDGALDEITCEAIRQHAWSRFTQGHAQEAIDTLQSLIERLANEGMADRQEREFQVLGSNLYLGRVFLHAGRPDFALEPLDRSIRGFERLGETQHGNLSAALGDRSSALMALGRLDEALESAERALAIDRALGQVQAAATGLGQTAYILSAQQRYAEAAVRYDEALAAARAAGDAELEGTLLQHQGTLQDELGRYDRAVELYQQALERFQQAGDEGSEMRTADLLGSAEQSRGHLDAAAAWYARSRELAERLGNRHQLAVTAQNVGILHQRRAELTEDPVMREHELQHAVASIEESLAVKLDMNNELGAANSYAQLGVLHRLLGELDEAEACLRQGLAISEAMALPDVYKDYDNLAKVARARGDEAAAAAWQAKHDAKLEEVQRLRRGGDGGEAPRELPDQVTAAILALAQAAYHARTSQQPVPPNLAEALARLQGLSAPMNALGAFLAEVAGGGTLPAPPEGLPPKIGAIVEGLLEELQK